MEDAACNARNDLVVLLALAEAMEAKVEEMRLGADRASPTVRDEDQLVSLAYAMANNARAAHKEIAERIAKHDAEESKSGGRDD